MTEKDIDVSNISALKVLELALGEDYESLPVQVQQEIDRKVDLLLDRLAIMRTFSHEQYEDTLKKLRADIDDLHDKTVEIERMLRRLITALSNTDLRVTMSLSDYIYRS